MKKFILPILLVVGFLYLAHVTWHLNPTTNLRDEYNDAKMGRFAHKVMTDNGIEYILGQNPGPNSARIKELDWSIRLGHDCIILAKDGVLKKFRLENGEPIE